MTNSITAITAKVAKRSLAARVELRRLRVTPLMQAPFLFAVSLLGIVLTAQAALLQTREMAWLRASGGLGELQAARPSAPVLPDPQAWDLQARWLAMQATRADGLRSQIGFFRQSADAARRHVQARPQWSMAWLNWARVSAQLHPAGRDWQAALLRALSLGDRGWAFQRVLAELVMRNESFMTPETRAATEKSLLLGLSENRDLADSLRQQGLLSALCAAPVSLEARQACVVDGAGR